MASGVEVGVRCYSSDGYYGTVRFIGEVPPTKGDWIGVEWDSPERGKHSGTHNGVEYFRCSVPNSGSFIRRDKVSFGLEFVQVFTERYSTDDTKICGTIGTKEVELVAGKEMHSTFVDVSLSETLLSSAGPPQSIENLCPNIKDLNLSKTLLSSWNEVAIICSQLHSLTKIDLSSNMMTTPTDPLSLVESFNNLSHLVITKMHMEWSDLRVILQMMTNLKYLTASNNRISCLGQTDLLQSHNVFAQSIKEIDFDNNNITEWSTVLSLKHLPNLCTLSLKFNKLKDVQYANEGDFPSLTSLLISDNAIESWCSIDALASFKSLTNLRVARNQILKDETELDGRLLVIARVPQVSMLNGSKVYQKERQNAEIHYIMKYFPDWIRAKKSGTERDFASNHIQYRRLSEVHGLPEEETIANDSPYAPTIKDRLLNLTILHVTSSKSLKRRLPESMTVQELKALCMGLFKVKTIDQKLYYRSHENDVLYELDNDLKEISFFAVETGDTIEIHPIH